MKRTLAKAARHLTTSSLSPKSAASEVETKDNATLRSRRRWLASALGLWIGLTSAQACSPVAYGQELGYIEKYAIGGDRSAALSELIPDTQEYFYYQCLYHQTIGKQADAQAFLDAWIAKHGETELARKMKWRQALLGYSSNPEKTIEFLRRELGVNVGHAAPQRDRAASLATSLDPTLIEYRRLLQESMNNNRGFEQIEDSAWVDLLAFPMQMDQLRAWLQRANRIDSEDLLPQIAKELQDKDSQGFGWANIHRQLSLEQLISLSKLAPIVIEQDAWVHTAIAKIRPSDDSSLVEPGVMREHVIEIQKFVDTLPVRYNSLKANILFHRLQLEYRRGSFDRELLLRYLSYPRNAYYYNSKLLQEQNQRGIGSIDFSYNLQPQTGLGPIGDDTELIKHYLEHFFQGEESIEAFAKLLDRGFLSKIFAETKILYGIGDAKPHYAKLDPRYQQELRDRVEMLIAPTNPTYYAPDAPVALQLNLKNVPQLIVKIYQLNSRNVLKANQRPVSTDIDLDGLVANAEKSFTYSQPADRRHAETIELPELTGRGIWVVDCLGGGQRSRALIHKGQLRSVQTITDAGHLFRILDESGKPVPSAHIELGERKFSPNKDGEIVVPYSSQVRTDSLLLVDNGFASIENFIHYGEQYQLLSGFILDPQSLLSGSKATVTFRPQLSCNGSPFSLEALEEVRLTIEATDQDGVKTTQTVSTLKLSDTSEATHTFLVPQRLANINFALTGRVFNQSLNQRQLLSANHSVDTNQLSMTQQLGDFFLSRDASGYRIETLGRNGEPIGRLPVQLQVKLRGLVNPVYAFVATDEAGILQLGELPNAQWVQVQSDVVASRQFSLEQNRIDWPNRLHALSGGELRLPWELKGNAGRLSLVEIRGNQFYRDITSKLSASNGAVSLKGLSGGNYRLTDHQFGQSVEIVVTEGKKEAGYLIGKSRSLQQSNYAVGQLKNVATSDKALTIELSGADDATRVHLIATAFHPTSPLSQALALPRSIPLGMSHNPLPSFYQDSLRLDEEYRYILQRQFAAKFPGNLLPQPSILINPWETSVTNNDRKDAAGGDDLQSMAAPPAAAPAPAAEDPFNAKREASNSASYEFMARSAVVLNNLIPNEDGKIVVDLKQLNGLTNVTLLLVHPTGTNSQQIALPRNTPLQLVDQRLRESFPIESHRAEKEQVRLIAAGEKIDLGEAKTTRIRIYSNLADLYQLYGTLLGNNADFEKFRFLTTWDTLSQEQKQAKYSEFACHELNLFLHEKDPEFFEKTIKPFLANKLEKQLIDTWLLDQDAASYEKSWQLQRLNAVERVLLAKKLEGQRKGAERHLADWVSSHPTPPNIRSSRFAAALIGSSLEGNRLEELVGEARFMKEQVALGESVTGSMVDRFGATDGAPMAASGGMGGGMGSGGMMGGLGAVPDNSADPFYDGAPADGPGGPPPGAQPVAGRPSSGAADKQKAAAEFEGGESRDARGAERRSVFFGLQRAKKASEMDLGLFRNLDTTRKWAESQYYHQPLGAQTAAMIAPNAFWKDYLAHSTETPFLSTHLDEPISSLSEAILALAVTDLPLKPVMPEVSVENGRIMVTSSVPSVAYVQSIETTQPSQDPTSILVGQDVYLVNPSADQSTQKPIQDQALVKGVPYRASVVVTNPSSQVTRVQVLHQIPQGAIPLSGGKVTRGQALELQPYSSQQVSYEFYFPTSGEFTHYGSQVSNDTGHLAASPSKQLRVLDKPENVDQSTWAYVADWGTDEQVLEFIKSHNLQQIDLTRIAFRMQNKEFFGSCLTLLSELSHFDATLWGYAVLHNDKQRLTEYLENNEGVARQVGPVFASELVNYKPEERFWYQHFDFRPLVVARSHQLGAKRTILNDGLLQQYNQLLEVLAFQDQSSDEQELAMVYYMLLQNRVDEAIAFFDKVDANSLSTRLQYDYFDAYLDFHRGNYDHAEEIAAKYTEYPQSRWRELFAQVATQVQQRKSLQQGTAPSALTSTGSPLEPDQQRLLDQREVQQAEQAKKMPALDLRLEEGRLTLAHQNISEVKVNYYLMDIELLFSRNPFVQQDAQRLSSIEANRSEALQFTAGKGAVEIAVPAPLQNKNMLVEVVGGGLSRSQVLYANSLDVTLVSSFGRVDVLAKEGRQPLDGAYVKVYARSADGSIKFYKDGYTDLRGSFDYATLSTNDLDSVQRFSILVMHPEHGAIIRESEPPKR